MTLSIRPDLTSADQVLSSLATGQKQTVTEAEMMQAVRTLLIGLGEDPDREGLKDTPKRVMRRTKRYSKKGDESFTVSHERIS